MNNNVYSTGQSPLMRNILALCITLFLLTVVAGNVVADQADELRNKIDDRNSRIEELEEEIEQYERELEGIQQEKQTLKNKIRELEISRRRLAADVSLTQENINATNYRIGQLTGQIQDKQAKIDKQQKAVGEAIRTIDEIGSTSLVEQLLLSESLADIWKTIDTLEKFQMSLRDHVARLQALKTELGEKRNEHSTRKQELVRLQNELQDKQAIIVQQKQTQDDLLLQTENKESSYQSLITEKERKKQQFEQELQQFEAQLEVVIDEGRLPEQGSGVLAWPLKNVRITQHFGNTAFAQSGAYNGSGHNGTDFGAPVGTELMAAASGNVIAFGNTDRTCPSASYGKWVLLEHDNGLSTLYAHLSLISVTRGQRVSTGDIIGYTGNTGYSTGPHLHFTVYASQGVRVDQFKSGACVGAIYTLPLAPFEAYRNPLDYLPRI